MATIIPPSKTANLLKQQQTVKDDKKEAPKDLPVPSTSLKQQAPNTKHVGNSQNFAVVPTQEIKINPENLQKVTIGGAPVDNSIFKGLPGIILLIAILVKATRVLFENQVEFNKKHSAAQKSGSETKTEETKTALTKQANKIKAAKENKANCDIIIDVLMIVVAVITAVLTGGIVAPVLLVLAAAVLVAKLAVDIRKKVLIDKGDYDAADDLDDAATGLEITAMVLSSLAGGAAIARSVASAVAELTARVAARAVEAVAVKVATTTLEAAAEDGEPVTESMVAKVVKRAIKFAVKEGVKGDATEEGVEEAAENGAKAGLEEAIKDTADDSPEVAKDAIKETAEDSAEGVTKKAIKTQVKAILKELKKQVKTVSAALSAGVSSFNALSVFSYKSEMTDADRIGDQLQILLMLINKIMAALSKLKEGGNKDTKALIDAVVSAMRSFGGDFRLATNTLSSLAKAMSPGGK